MFLYPFYYFIKVPETQIINPYYAGICLLFVLAFFAFIRDRKSYGFNIFDICLMLFCLCFMLSTILAEDPFRSGYFAFRAIFIPVATYFVIKSYAKSQKAMQDMVKYLLYGMTLYVFIGLALSTFTGVRGGVLDQTPVAASSISATVFIIVMFSNYRKFTWAKIAVVCAVILTVFTFSRMSYLVILISPLLYLIIRRGHFTKVFIFLFPVLLAFTLLLPLNKKYLHHDYVSTAKLSSIERITTLSFYKRALLLRIDQYEDGLAYFSKHPVLGTGIQEYQDVITFHNFHIEWLAYGGVISYTFAFLSFMVFALRHSKTAKEDNWMAVYLLLVTAVFLNCFTNGIMHGIRPDMVYMFVGLAEARKKVLAQAAEEVLPPAQVT